MCTSILQVAQDGTHLFSRTMDWHELENEPVFSPRNYAWREDFDGRTLVNKYAIIGVGRQKEQSIDMSDGVNEWGLSVQKLTFRNGTNLYDDPQPEAEQLAPFEIPFYLMGNFKSVAEIIEHLPEIRLMSGKNATVHYGYPELHYAATDPSGRIVIIEPTVQPMNVIDNPIGVVTNAYDFSRQVNQLKDYLEFSPELVHKSAAGIQPKISTGSFAGKKVPSSAYTPTGRFIRAAYYKERTDQPLNEEEAVISSWHLLNSVTVPKLRKFQQNYSVYRSAVALESRTCYFEPYDRLGLTKYQLTDEMLEWEKPRFFDSDNRLNVRAGVI
ncbi:choloylglycine hydrolase [Ligilactobacillus salitolerans]|uniref:Choloylglycine hydrolase n=1 Tax=Ligilactobacillus salitolerans TaxID=1808352 RepID=A0A401IRR1_9LACO|nr:linear amide C-N hydrolase [Ligilactobacillus salitolerans]GBG94206.1 choloylglycine hydrolase [Ligilactobacillus salitolerans]